MSFICNECKSKKIINNKEQKVKKSWHKLNKKSHWIFHFSFFTFHLQASLLPCSGTRTLVFAVGYVELVAHGKVDVAQGLRLVD